MSEYHDESWKKTNVYKDTPDKNKGDLEKFRKELQEGCWKIVSLPLKECGNDPKQLKTAMRRGVENLVDFYLTVAHSIKENVG